ncbi:MAG: T9SS type A sorting domain-containing protein [Bacteroidia bacterium]
MKKIVFVILLAVTATSFAQTIPNGSFEQVDSAGNLLNWKINNGVVKRVSSKVFYGIPFTATDSLFYLMMENDTMSSPNTNAVVTNMFPLSSSPQSFSWDGFYTLTFPNLDFGLDILFTKWKNNARDTILFYSHPMIYASLMDSNNLSIQWVKTNLDLHSSYHDTITQPDTAMITFRNDFVWNFPKSHILILDHLLFSNWRVGIDELSAGMPFHIFPNPANDNLFIDLNSNENATIVIYNSLGELVKKLQTPDLNSGKNEISVSDLYTGIYFIRINSGRMSFQKKFIISR